MKKRILIFVLLIIFAFVYGCNKVATTNETPAPSAISTTPGINFEDAITRTPDITGIFPPISTDELRIGVIYNTDQSVISSDAYSHDQGIEEMRKQFSLKKNQIIKKNVSDNDSALLKKALDSCINSNCHIIFGTSRAYMDIMEEYSIEYPNIIFSNATGYKSNQTNFNNYYGRIYQARYLSGIVAGLNTKTNKIGYVAAFGLSDSEVTGGCNAFAMGVYSVNEKAKIYIRITNSYNDPEEEHFATVELIDKGCDLIAQHCGSSVPQVTAQNSKIFGIGYNSDMSLDAPDAVLTSVVWNWGIYYKLAIFNIIAGEWVCENYFGSLGEGFVDITPLSELCVKGTKEKVEEAREKIASGAWDVFDGEHETNTGETKVSTHYGDIDWYFKNIIDIQSDE